MAYRNDVEALEARLAHLQTELGDRTRERDEVASLLADARARQRAEQVVAELPARRRRRRRAVIALALASVGALALGFAAHRVRHRDVSAFAEAMYRFEQLTNQMCQCTDASCAQRVSDELTRWASAMAKQWGDEQPKPDNSQMERAQKIATRFAECMQRAMTVEPEPPHAQRPHD